MTFNTADEPHSAQLNKRKSKRQICSIRASLSFNDIFLCHCVIKDISVSGMRLFAPKVGWLPHKFQVKAAPFDKPITVTKSWGHGEHIGVRFSFDNDPKTHK